MSASARDTTLLHDHRLERKASLLNLGWESHCNKWKSVDDGLAHRVQLEASDDAYTTAGRLAPAGERIRYDSLPRYVRVRPTCAQSHTSAAANAMGKLVTLPIVQWLTRTLVELPKTAGKISHDRLIAASRISRTDREDENSALARESR
jgi:hypothetical protein